MTNLGRFFEGQRIARSSYTHARIELDAALKSLCRSLPDRYIRAVANKLPRQTWQALLFLALSVYLAAAVRWGS